LEPPAGFEPATTGLQGRRSTALSYGGLLYTFIVAGIFEFFAKLYCETFICCLFTNHFVVQVF
jgi:hypothetical protein